MIIFLTKTGRTRVHVGGDGCGETFAVRLLDNLFQQ